MVRATYQLMAVDDVPATLTVTMTVKQWREIADRLPETWPHWEFGAKVREMIRHADQQFSERQDSP
jgi:hypothetical protein